MTTRRPPQGPPPIDPGPPPIDPGDRSTEARLARLHLRSGAFGLARAELETLVGAGTLDDEALLDLAEVRWRTGDLAGAGEAAQAYLATGREAAIGLVIAAEAAAALGRPGEARRLATRAIEHSEVPLDRIFAGIARSGVWPTDPADPGEPAGTFFAPPDGVTDRSGRGGSAGFAPGAAGVEGVAVAGVGVAAAGPRNATGAGDAAVAGTTALAAGTLGEGFWDAAAVGEAGDLEPPDPRDELDAARRAMSAGDVESAAVHLTVALRLEPSLAPAVLDLAGTQAGPGLDIVRGDAYRLAGHEADALHAYTSAARAPANVTAPPSAESQPSPAADASAAEPQLTATLDTVAKP